MNIKKSGHSFILSILILAMGHLAVYAQQPASPPGNFKHQTTTVNGVDIHYMIGGEGEPLVLIHGFAQNWYMWNRLLPELSKHFTVIAPDLRGVGESGKPTGGYDKKTMAADIHELVIKLGYHNINLAGHDIGLMVAYAYAAEYGNEVKKVAFLDALLPGIEPVWSDLKEKLWWFGFFAWPASGQVVDGKEREFLSGFWPVVGHINDAFTKQETEEFIRAYSVKGATTGSFHWFAAFEQDAKDNLEFMKNKLRMPVLTMGGEYQSASFLGEHFKKVAINVKEMNIKGAGHWLVQEQTQQVLKGLLDFFMGNQLRMTNEEILKAKAVGPTAPGSSNLNSIQVIVIHGDPSVKGLYTILLKVPANTKIAAHLHPDDRVATVIDGTWYFGYGDSFDKSKLKKLPAGSVYTEVESQNHFAMTGNKPVVVEITGYGPSGVTYVNAADDPKKNSN